MYNAYFISKNIEYHRKRLGLSQRELAQRVGVSAQAVSKWENAQSYPDPLLISDLCRVLSIDINTLFSPPPQPEHSADAYTFSSASTGESPFETSFESPFADQTATSSQDVKNATSDSFDAVSFDDRDKNQAENSSESQHGHSSENRRSSEDGHSNEKRHSSPHESDNTHQQEWRQSASASGSENTARQSTAWQSDTQRQAPQNDPETAFIQGNLPEDLHTLSIDIPLAVNMLILPSAEQARYEIQGKPEFVEALNFQNDAGSFSVTMKENIKRFSGVYLDLNLRDLWNALVHAKANEKPSTSLIFYLPTKSLKTVRLKTNGSLWVESRIYIENLDPQINGSLSGLFSKVGNLIGNINGSSSLKIDELHSSNINCNGSARLTIQKCTGGIISLQIPGAFKGKIVSGEIEELNVNVYGAGSLSTYDTHIQVARLNYAGAFKAKIPNCDRLYKNNRLVNEV